MRIFLLSFCIFFNLNLFAQKEFQKAPSTFDKIIFVYQQKPKILFKEKCFYLDTTLVKIYLKDIKYSTTYLPSDTTQICARVYYDDVLINKEYKDILESLVYHGFEKITGVYDVKKNTTKFKVYRNDDQAKEIYAKYLKAKYPSEFSYRCITDYNENIVYLYTDQQRDCTPKHFVGNVVFLNDSKTEADFWYQTSDYKIIKSIVTFNTSLNPKIAPIRLFKNTEYGVELFDDYFMTYELIDVKYE